MTNTSSLRHTPRRPTLTLAINHLYRPLLPLHQEPSGFPHPSFPSLILQYHLLTEPQLDSLARYYHQWTTSPCPWTLAYPTTMRWDAGFLAHVGERHGIEARIAVKRRKFGRFIGLRDCETPVEEVEEWERFEAAREAARVKTAGDWAFAGRDGFRRW